jgi:tetratricopeptide (TPR) repeat protein
VPALINLGNILYLKSDYPGARDLYARALAERPDNPSALLGYVKTNYELERYGEVNESLARLRMVDPAAAGTVAFMASSSGGMRASAAMEKSVEGWNE